MVAVSLVYFTAVGSEVLAALPIEGECSTFYLPDDPPEHAISLSSDIDGLHSSLCLEVHHNFVLLRTFNDTTDSCSVLGDSRIEVRLPLSTTSHHKSIILHADVQFLGPSGRWGIRWGDMEGPGSNSMKTPLRPLITEHASACSVAGEQLQGLVGAEAVTKEAASQGQSNESTRSPTPPPTNKGDRNENPGTENERFEEIFGESGVPDTPHDSSHAGERYPIKELDVGLDNHQATPNVPSTAGQEDAANECLYGAVEKISAHNDYSPSTRDTAIPRPGPPGTQERGQGTDGAPTVLATEQRRKRKLTEIESTDSSLGTADAGFSRLNGGVSTDGIIVSISPNTKKMYATTGEKQTTNTPARQSRACVPPTVINATFEGSLSKEQPSAKRRPTRRTRISSSGKYSGATPVVIFSGSTSIQEKRPAMETFERLGGKVSTAIDKAGILCIPEGPLKKTGKLIMAVAMGVDIVTEKWIADTHRLGRFPPLEEYLPLDGSRERQWDFNLKDAIGRGKDGLKHLLCGTTVFLTKQLRTALGSLEREISQVATILGADAVKHRLPALRDKDKVREAEVLIIGVPGDPQGAHVGRLGHTLFNKDILTMAALRGRVERDSAEFRIEVPIEDEDEEN